MRNEGGIEDGEDVDQTNVNIREQAAQIVAVVRDDGGGFAGAEGGGGSAYRSRR